MPLCESELSLLGVFLDYMHTGSYLLICETQSPPHDLWDGATSCSKEALFLWGVSFCLDLGGGGHGYHTYYPSPQVLYLSAFNKRRNPILRHWVSVL